MKKFLLVGLTVVCALPAVYAAQPGHGCHGGHGGHGGGHSGGHGGCHASSHSYHSGHSYRGGRTYSGGSRGEPGLQSPRKGINEIVASTGALSSLAASDGNTVRHSSPVYSGAYRYYPTNGISLNVGVSNQNINGIDTCKCIGSAPLIYDYYARALTVVTGVNVILYTKAYMQAYMGLDLGVSMISEHDNYADNTTEDFTQYKFAGQLTLVGIRYGHALGGFAEVGLGYKGLVCAGLSYQAGWKKAHKRA